jgi:hypothetical protein
VPNVVLAEEPKAPPLRAMLVDTTPCYILAERTQLKRLPIDRTDVTAGKIDLELIEVQTGSYLGEDDIVRVEDDYHRA